MKARHSIALLLIVVAAADVADVADGAKRAKKVTADTTITNKVRGRKRGGVGGCQRSPLSRPLHTEVTCVRAAERAGGRVQALDGGE